MRLLSKPSRRLLINTLKRVHEDPQFQCTCKIALLPQCPWCDVKDVLAMQERGKTIIVEGAYHDGDQTLKLRSGRVLSVGRVSTEDCS